MRFVASKTRVSPLRKQTIPRLELLSALLLARLMDTVSEILKSEVVVSDSAYFTDSKVALYWIRGWQKSWRPFVQNRVVEIRNLTCLERWQHCPGTDNPADISSRGISPSELLDNTVWKDGPSIPPPSVWTIVEIQSEDPTPIDCEVELRASDKSSTTGMLTGDVSSLVQIEDFSELTHLFGVVTQVLRFCSVLMKKTGSGRHTAFDGREREVAERVLIQNAQGSLRE